MGRRHCRRLRGLCTTLLPAPTTSSAAAAGVREASSLSGAPLCRRSFEPAQRERLEADLALAAAEHTRAPGSVDAAVWHARRLGYLDRYQEAIAVLTRAITHHPAEPQLYRHRGHRYITVRRFREAVEDLTQAAALIDGAEGVPDSVEPDGQPNAAGVPTSTLHTNIYYHLGLAHFLLGEFESSVLAYRRGLAAPLLTADMRVAFSDWLFLALQRLGRDQEAGAVLSESGAFSEQLIQDLAYRRRLQLYAGQLRPEEVLRPDDASTLDVATQGYGVACYLLARGQRSKAVALLEKVAETPYWPSFASCAAEAELQRLLSVK